ncbi:MAG: DUF393 domain-containing protein [Planctomycetes bacterium]|nr:DUF393 domain-containing protein [Planctomycetota bacterium]
MRNGWTGGQISLVRVAFALPLVFVGACGPLAATRGVEAVLSLALLIVGVLFLCGAYVRVLAGLYLAFAVWSTPGVRSLWSDAPIPVAGVTSASWVVGLAFFSVVLLLPRAPYGSWPARGRVDPGGGWEFPRWLFAGVWVFWIAFHVATAARELAEWRASGAELGALAWLELELQALFVIFVWSRRTRAWAWLALVAWSVASVRADATDVSFSPTTVVLIALTFDPAWIPSRAAQVALPRLDALSIPRPPADARPIAPTRTDAQPIASRSDPRGARPIVFFDGGCALCHGFVRFALAEDREGTRLRFAPLGGATAERELAAHAPLCDDERELGVHAPLCDSVVADGEVLVRSRAVVRVLEALGGLWRIAAWFVQLPPAAWSDDVYDFVAARRKRWFAPPKSACPLLPPEIARRLDA